MFKKNNSRGHIAFTTHEDNVLTPEGMLKLLELHRAVNSVNVDGKVYNDFCFKIPITDLFGKTKKRRRRQVTDFFDERDLDLVHDHDLATNQQQVQAGLHLNDRHGPATEFECFSKTTEFTYQG